VSNEWFRRKVASEDWHHPQIDDATGWYLD